MKVLFFRRPYCRIVEERGEEMDDKKAIVFVLDDAYLAPGLLAIKDVCENAGAKYPVYVFHGASLSELSRAKLTKLADTQGTDLRLKDVSKDGQMFADLDIRTHVSNVAYAKHLIGELLWEGFETAYYFDVDILVLGDLSRLFEIKPKKAMAAVNHNADELRQHLLGEPGPYYNTGVLAINLIRWQTINAVEKFKSTIAEYSRKFRYHDQDIFAVAFDGEIEEIPIEFNFMLNGRYNSYVRSTPSSDWDPLEISPAIVHFIGPTKPWSPNAGRHSHRLWRKRANLM